MRGGFGGFKDHVWEELEELDFADMVREAAHPEIEYQRGSRGRAVVAGDPSTYREDPERTMTSDKRRDPKRDVRPTADKPNPKDSISQSVAVRYSEFDDCPDGYYFCTKAKDCVPIPDGEGIMESGMRARFEYHEQYDFVACMRPDGSIYGTAGVCRKGTETVIDREEVKARIKKAGGQIDKIGDRLDKLDDAQLATVANNVSDMLGNSRGRNVGEMDWDSVKALDKNRDKLMEGFKDPSKLTGNLKKVSDEEADAFYSLLPKKTQQQLNKAGTLKNTQYLREDGSHGAASDWRGRQLAKRWLEQDGKDLYTGRKLNINDADLEHIIPYKIGGNRSEQLDNFGWIGYASNQRKASDSMEDFFRKKVDKPLAMGESKYRTNVYGKAVKKAEEADFLANKGPFYAKNPNQLTDSVIKQFGPKLYYVTRDWGVKHGFKKDRASTRYFSDFKIPGKNQKFTEYVVRTWPNATPRERALLKALSNRMSRRLTAGVPTEQVMADVAEVLARARM